MDHRTLENFESQKDLSRCQARWMEFMSQFDTKIVYVKGEDNTVADALSRTDFKDSCEAESHAATPFEETDSDAIAALYSPTLESPFHAARCLARTRIHAPQTSELTSVCPVMFIGVGDEFLDIICRGYELDLGVQSLTP
jgi:hypothetical protein